MFGWLLIVIGSLTLTSKCTNNGRWGKHRQTYCSTLYIPWRLRVRRCRHGEENAFGAKRSWGSNRGMGLSLKKKCSKISEHTSMPAGAILQSTTLTVSYSKIPCHRKERERNQPKKLTTSAGLIRVVSLLIIQDRPLSPTPFPTSSSQNIFHASTDLWTRSIHTLTDQQNRKAELKTPTLPFMKNP
jgi:hypothetical protein